MEAEICEMCRSVLKEIEKPEGTWRVTVMRAPGQLNIAGVHLDHEVRQDDRIDVRTEKFGVYRPEWKTLSLAEREFLVRTRLEETIRKFDHANV